MKNILLYFLLFVLASEALTLGIIKRDKPQEKILAETTSSLIVSPTPTPSPSPTPTPSPKLTPKPTKAPTPRPTPIPQPTFSSQQINEFVGRFATQYSVSPDVLRYIALCESGFNPLAENLSYAGLFQFGPVTWKNIRGRMGEETNIDLRLNAEESVQTAAYAISVGYKEIWPNCYP